MPYPDLYATTRDIDSLAAESITASQTVHGTGIKTADYESIVAQCRVASLGGAPTGGNVTFTVEDSPDNTTFTPVVDPDVGALTAVALFSDTLPETLRMRYKAGANGRQPYVRVSATAALTGGSSPTAIVAADFLQSLRYAGKMPSAGAYPQVTSPGLAN